MSILAYIVGPHASFSRAQAHCKVSKSLCCVFYFIFAIHNELRTTGILKCILLLHSIPCPGSVAITRLAVLVNGCNGRARTVCLLRVNCDVDDNNFFSYQISLPYIFFLKKCRIMFEMSTISIRDVTNEVSIRS